MKESIEIGPFGCFFTNVNTVMKLPGHSHTANVFLQFATVGDTTGFPSFETTGAIVAERIKQLCARAFRDATNEIVARRMFVELDRDYAHEHAEQFAKWRGRYVLRRLTLDVIGVHDDIGHAEGATRYRITRSRAECAARALALSPLEES